MSNREVEEEIEQVKKTGFACYKYVFVTRSGMHYEGNENVESVTLDQLYELDSQWAEGAMFSFVSDLIFLRMHRRFLAFPSLKSKSRERKPCSRALLHSKKALPEVFHSAMINSL